MADDIVGYMIDVCCCNRCPGCQQMERLTEVLAKFEK